MSVAISAQSFAGFFPYQAGIDLSELDQDVTRITYAKFVASIAVSGMSGQSIFFPTTSYHGTVPGNFEARPLLADQKVVELLPSRFAKLAAQWKGQKSAFSSITAMAMLPVYQQIIGMGEPAVPLILAQLKSEGDQPDMWFWALKAITGADPVQEDDRGDMLAMSKAWQHWGSASSVS